MSVVANHGVGPVGALWRYLPDGRLTRSDDTDFDEAISAMLGELGRLQTAIPQRPIPEEYWPDIEGLDLRDTVAAEARPEETFSTWPRSTS
jgi:hypothetical protein